MTNEDISIKKEINSSKMAIKQQEQDKAENIPTNSFTSGNFQPYGKAIGVGNFFKDSTTIHPNPHALVMLTQIHVKRVDKQKSEKKDMTLYLRNSDTT